MDGTIVGVSVGVIMIGINTIINHIKNKRSSDRVAIQLLLKCNLTQLCALKKSGIINGDCDDVLDELNEFLIKK